jgi:hypothetical protein
MGSDRLDKEERATGIILNWLSYVADLWWALLLFFSDMATSD